MRRHFVVLGKLRFVIQFSRSVVPRNATTMWSGASLVVKPTNACVELAWGVVVGVIGGEGGRLSAMVVRWMVRGWYVDGTAVRWDGRWVSVQG